MTYDECCSGRDWRVHITKRLWLGFGRSICRYISSIHHSQMLSSLLLGSISICQPKKLHYKRTPKIHYRCKTTPVSKIQTSSMFSGCQFPEHSYFSGTSSFPPPLFPQLLEFYRSRRRLVGLPQWKEVQLTSHLKGSWVKRHGGLLNDPMFCRPSQICGCWTKNRGKHPPKCMVKMMEFSLLIHGWFLGGKTHYFWKHP